MSVVIPTYERADVLPRAVDSALDQTVRDIEVIVVDDGSTDGTLTVLDAYDDPRLRVISHGTNRGANVARNTGIEHADGEFVAFLDSDDEWHPEKLERQLARYEAAPAECVAVYCDFQLETGGLGGRAAAAVAGVLARADEDRPKEGGKEISGEILADHLHSGAGSTLMVETDVARAVDGFDEELDRYQDPDFLLRVLQEGYLGYVDDPLVTRYDTGSPSASTIEGAAEQFITKHASLVRAAEADGYNVEGSHDLLLTKSHLAEGSFRKGLGYLRNARVRLRHLPGVLWSLLAGVRRRTPTLTAVVLLTLGLSALGRSRR